MRQSLRERGEPREHQRWMVRPGSRFRNYLPAEFRQRLRPFLERYLPRFQRAEQRSNAALLLRGKLSSLSRKTCEPIAHLFGVRREILQDFLGSSPWTDDAVLGELRAHVTEAWA